MTNDGFKKLPFTFWFYPKKGNRVSVETVDDLQDIILNSCKDLGLTVKEFLCMAKIKPYGPRKSSPKKRTYGLNSKCDGDVSLANMISGWLYHGPAVGITTIEMIRHYLQLFPLARSATIDNIYDRCSQDHPWITKRSMKSDMRDLISRGEVKISGEVGGETTYTLVDPECTSDVMYSILPFGNFWNSDGSMREDYIQLVKQGYMLDTHEPLKCVMCESTELKDMYHHYEEGHVISYERICSVCDRVNGQWSYGNWCA